MIENILASLQQILKDILPTAFLSILLIIFGWVLGRIFKGLTESTMNRLRIDEHVKLGKRIGFTETVSLLVFWIIFLVFLNSALSLMKIEVLTNYFSLLTNFVINLLGGIFILIIGYSVSSYVERKVLQSKMQHADLISKIIFAFSIIITIEMSLKVIGLPTQILDSILIILVASLGLGIAIAIGLGLKDVVSEKAKKALKD